VGKVTLLLTYHCHVGDHSEIKNAFVAMRRWWRPPIALTSHFTTRIREARARSFLPFGHKLTPKLNNDNTVH
jgi:hypothetical protein